MNVHVHVYELHKNIYTHKHTRKEQLALMKTPQIYILYAAKPTMRGNNTRRNAHEHNHGNSL